MKPILLMILVALLGTLGPYLHAADAENPPPRREAQDSRLPAANDTSEAASPADSEATPATEATQSGERPEAGPDESTARVAPNAGLPTSRDERPVDAAQSAQQPGDPTQKDHEPLPPAPPSPSRPPTPGAAPTEPLPEGMIRLNFRNAPLELVLNHLSEAAGFIIDLQTEVKGRVNVWSSQPITKDEAIDVLNTSLHRNGYAAIRNGRTLTIVARDEAKKRDIPVKSGANPDDIPRSDEIVTQIIPVRFINAVQLTKDLQPLLPTEATMTANEGGNALVITDTQANIRRMAEIVRAIDTAISSVSSVRVFPLKFADAKTLATVVKDLFQSQQESTRNTQGPGQGRFQNFMRGGPGGPGGGQTAADTSSGRAPTQKVVAVADERSNSLVVTAPEEQMLIIEDLVRQVDVSVEDVTELRVFRLRYADAEETADLLANLFPDPTTSTQQGTRGAIQFGGRFGFQGGPGGMRQNAATDTSARTLKQSRVLAVPDLRTSSIIVSASRDLMEQIARMIEALDSDPSKKQKVFVYSVENTDPEAVQQIIESLFPNQNYGTSSATRRQNTTRQTGNQLNNRATTTQRNQQTGNRTGSTGFGGQNIR